MRSKKTVIFALMTLICFSATKSFATENITDKTKTENLNVNEELNISETENTNSSKTATEESVKKAPERQLSKGYEMLKNATNTEERKKANAVIAEERRKSNKQIAKDRAKDNKEIAKERKKWNEKMAKLRRKMNGTDSFSRIQDSKANLSLLNTSYTHTPENNYLTTGIAFNIPFTDNFYCGADVEIGAPVSELTSLPEYKFTDYKWMAQAQIGASCNFTRHWRNSLFIETGWTMDSWSADAGYNLELYGEHTGLSLTGACGVGKDFKLLYKFSAGFEINF